MASLVAARTGDADRVLDLGCGLGYIAHLILEKRPGLSIVGIDRNAQALGQARDNLAGYAGTFTGIAGDLEDIAGIDAPDCPLGDFVSPPTEQDWSGGETADGQPLHW